MNAASLVLPLAAFGAVTFGVSGLLGALSTILGRGARELAPRAQARLYLTISALPLAAGVAVMTAVLAPRFGWIIDLCCQGATAGAHPHPHLCGELSAGGWPGASLALLAMLVVVRLVWALAGAGSALITLAKLKGELARTVEAGALVPVDAPAAFVLGLWRPRVYVTRGLHAPAYREHLASVLAHEEAHRRRRDPLRRLLAGLALAFHLPGVAGWLARRLAETQEMAADVEAALAVGSRTRVAHALVALARPFPMPLPAAASAFGAARLEARVLAILDERPRRDSPSPRAIGIVLGAALLAVVWRAAELHHDLEHLLGLLGG
jgi:Zn-dependent protease with chaperone function